MISAFFYLQWTMMRNALWQRIRRLRQPKYLLGALAGGAYFYFVLFARGVRHSRPPRGGGDFFVTLEPAAAPLLAVVVLLAWLWGNRRAALKFTEPETAFLFPAPVSRRALIHFKLLRAQLGILFSAVFMALLFRRDGSGTLALIHAAGWWLLFSVLSLHFIGASFMRQRLLDRGLHPWRQRLLVGGGLLVLATGGWLALRRALPGPTPADLADLSSLLHYASLVISQPPVSWVLAPFRWATRPFFAPDATAFALAAGPALLLLAAHYVWVIRSDVAFEEASIEQAAKRAERLALLRAGRWDGGRGPPKKARPEPFRLDPSGGAPLAFLWKNLIALGPFFRLRTWLIACVALAGLIGWLAADRSRSDYLPMIAIFGGMFGVGLLFAGPMFMRREVQQTLPTLDMIKGYPLAGWQIVFGQLLTPMIVLTFIEWFLLLGLILSIAAGRGKVIVTMLWGGGAAGGLALVVPPLCGLLLCLPYAGVLYFPAWGSPQTGGAGSGGVEVLGQRLIFFAGYLLVTVVALLPAAGISGLVFFIAQALLGKITAVVLTTLALSGVLALELAGAVWFLGEKLERFDLSQELPR